MKSAVLGLSATRRKKVESACARLMIPNVLNADFTEAQGRYVLSHLVAGSAS